jgi:hypothetical protein
VFGAESPAAAFCRTTTEHVPNGYDPVASGCYFRGLPVSWAAGQSVPYVLSAAASQQIALADAEAVAARAFYAWSSTICSAGIVNISAYYNGTVSAEVAASDCGPIMCDPTVHDSLHVISFVDQNWPYTDAANTLALTTVTFGIDSGQIYDADIQINSAEHMLSVAEPPPSDSYDLQAILTHEAGHFFGLAHAPSMNAVMYAFYQPGTTALTPDDIDGICTVYPPQNNARCTCDVVHAEANGAAVATCASLVILAAARRRSRPRRQRRSV